MPQFQMPAFFEGRPLLTVQSLKWFPRYPDTTQGPIQPPPFYPAVFQTPPLLAVKTQKWRPTYPDTVSGYPPLPPDATSWLVPQVIPILVTSSGAAGPDIVYAQLEEALPFGAMVHPVGGGLRGFGVRGGSKSGGMGVWTYHDPFLADKKMVGPLFVVDLKRKN